MITLTTPSQINTILGGSSLVGYDKLVLSPFSMNPVEQSIHGNVRITSTGSPNMQAITGIFSMNVPRSELIIEVSQLDFYRRIVLSSAQNTAVLNQIESSQKAIEDGLLAMSVISGIRTAGV